MLLGLLAMACPTPADPPSLSISVTSNLQRDSTAKVTVSATGSGGVPGSGSVTLEASSGTLAETALTLKDGTARTEFACVNADCMSSVTLTAKWNALTATHSIHILDGGMPVVPDAGSPDAGPLLPPLTGPYDAGPLDALDTFDPARIWLVGSLELDGGGGYAIAPLDAPTDVRAGLPLDGTGLGIASGPLLISNTSGEVRRFAHESLDGGAFPSAPSANDPLVAKSCGSGVVDYVLPSPEGNLLARCSDGTSWLDGQRLTTPGLPVAVGHNGRRVEVDDGGLHLISGTQSLEVPFPDFGGIGVRSFRATPTGFRFVLETLDGGCRLYSIDSSGAVSFESEFSSPPPGITTTCSFNGGVLGPDLGTLYVKGVTDDGGLVVVARDAGASSVVYTAPVLPPDYVTGNVSLNTRFVLITGP
jgi:hypothetical protein